MDINRFREIVDKEEFPWLTRRVMLNILDDFIDDEKVKQALSEGSKWHHKDPAWLTGSEAAKAIAASKRIFTDEAIVRAVNSITVQTLANYHYEDARLALHYVKEIILDVLAEANHVKQIVTTCNKWYVPRWIQKAIVMIRVDLDISTGICDAIENRFKTWWVDSGIASREKVREDVRTHTLSWPSDCMPSWPEWTGNKLYPIEGYKSNGNNWIVPSQLNARISLLTHMHEVYERKSTELMHVLD